MASDLFDALHALFHKGPVEKPPSLFVVNRFLAWEQDYAPYAAAVSGIRDNDMAWAVWKTALPRQPRSPRLGYPVPKRRPAVEGLVAVLVEDTHLSREEAETAADLVEATGMTAEMFQAYGRE